MKDYGMHLLNILTASF